MKHVGTVIKEIGLLDIIERVNKMTDSDIRKQIQPNGRRFVETIKTKKKKSAKWAKREKKLKQKRQIQKPQPIKKTNYSNFAEQTPKERHTEYINSIYWARRKDEWYSKNLKICYACSSEDNIHLHHMYYGRLGFERDEDLVSLCGKCHQSLHDKYGTSNLRENTIKFIEDTNKEIEDILDVFRASPP